MSRQNWNWQAIAVFILFVTIDRSTLFFYCNRFYIATDFIVLRILRNQTHRVAVLYLLGIRIAIDFILFYSTAVLRSNELHEQEVTECQQPKQQQQQSEPKQQEQKQEHEQEQEQEQKEEK